MSPARSTATSDSVNEVATVRIELQHTDPLIWRRVEVPTSITLKVLHDIIQAVMGWFDCHLWEFTIGKPRYALPMDEDWGTVPRRDASKIRLRDVEKPSSTTCTTSATTGSISSPSPMSAPVSPACPIRTISVANKTGHPRIAAASPVLRTAPSDR